MEIFGRVHAGLFALLLAVTVVGCNGDNNLESAYTVQAGSVVIEVLAPQGVLRSGTNNVAVRVLENGEPISVDEAQLHFFMPAMGTMARMDTHTQLRGRQDRAEGRIAFEMGGGWNGRVDVTTARGSFTGTFNAQVR